MLSSAASDAELKAVEVDSLVIEQVQGNTVPKVQTVQDEPTHELSLPHGHNLTEKEQLVPDTEEEVARKKQTSPKRLE